MQRLFVVAISALWLFSCALSVSAGERQRLGFGILVTNDAAGDMMDRWRTGSVATSRVWGKGWTGAAPQRFGELLEFRLGGEVISPAHLVSPAPWDRPYAGALSAGVHSHFQRGGYEIAAGADIVMTGPQTRLEGLQSAIHDLLGFSRPSAAVRAGQIANGLHPTLVVEAGRSMALGDRAEVRPFIEGRLGAETLVRAGADLTFGSVGGLGELLIRDPVSGHRYRTIKNDNANGVSFVLGADIARVEDSVFLPQPAYTLTDARRRVRAGVHWQGKNGGSGFYGLTWLGEEFTGQSEAQVVGSLRLQFKF